jgi:hypothetical protein
VLASFLIALIAATLQVAGQTATPPPQEPPPYVLENGPSEQVSNTGGVFQLKAGPGWSRTRPLHNNFILTVQFRLLDDHTDAGIGIRTLTAGVRWPKTGYHVRLSTSDPSGTVDARKAQLVTVTQAPAPPVAPNTWHVLVVTAADHRIHVAIDDITTAASRSSI